MLLWFRHKILCLCVCVYMYTCTYLGSEAQTRLQVECLELWRLYLSTFCASFFPSFFPLPTVPFLPQSLRFLGPQNSSVSWRKRNIQGLGCGEGFGGGNHTEKRRNFLKKRRAKIGQLLWCLSELWRLYCGACLRLQRDFIVVPI